MKTYKLNRNWYPFEEGAEFIKIKDGDDVYVSKVNDDVTAVIPADMLNDISDYWNPTTYGHYYCIDDEGAVNSDTFCPTMKYDNNRLSIGNCFKAEEDAQAVVDWLKARHNLIESGARFISSQDAEDYRKYYVVYFNVRRVTLEIDDIRFNEHNVCERRLHFDSERIARRSIEEHKNDWLVYLGVKEPEE